MVCCKGAAAGLLMSTVPFPGIASAGDEWEFEIGGGLGYESEGSDEMEVMFLPVAGITWKATVYLTTGKGLGAAVYNINNPEFALNPSSRHKPRNYIRSIAL